jgi:hypothetical protein
MGMQFGFATARLSLSLRAGWHAVSGKPKHSQTAVVTVIGNVPSENFLDLKAVTSMLAQF